MKRLELRLRQLNITFNHLAKKATKSLRPVLVKLLQKIFQLEQMIAVVAKPTTKEITLNTPRKAWRAWLAKISNKKDFVHGGFKKDFVEPINREFDRKGETSATFLIPIDYNAIYQDSDNDYWVFEGEGDIKIISYQEVCYRFSRKA